MLPGTAHNSRLRDGSRVPMSCTSIERDGVHPDPLDRMDAERDLIKNLQIPPDFVVKDQAIDIIDVILRWL
jgi:hypothetical protein